VVALARDSARMVPGVGVGVALGRGSYAKIAALAEQATFQHRPTFSLTKISELMRSGRHDLRRFSVPAEVSCHAEGAGPPR
jgi:hypothetical protein